MRLLCEGYLRVRHAYHFYIISNEVAWFSRHTTTRCSSTCCRCSTQTDDVFVVPRASTPQVWQCFESGEVEGAGGDAADQPVRARLPPAAARAARHHGCALPPDAQGWGYSAPCHPMRRVGATVRPATRCAGLGLHTNSTLPPQMQTFWCLGVPCTLSGCSCLAAPSGGSLSCVAPHMQQCLGVGACSTDVHSKWHYFGTQSDSATHGHFFKLQFAIGKRLQPVSFKSKTAVE